MATKVDTSVSTDEQLFPKRFYRFPWHAWVRPDPDGTPSVWRLEQAIDFPDMSVHDMQNRIHQHARSHGLQAKTRSQGTTVTFSFAPKEEVLAHT